MPYDIDVLDRRIRQLEIELLALKKETDKASQERRADIEQEIADLKEDLNGKKAQWQNEKEVIDQIRTVKNEMDEAKREEEIAERKGDLGKVAEIRYGKLNELQKKLDEENDRLARMQESGGFLSEDVTEEQIARIVGRWTGIPVERLMEGEMDRLLHLEDRLAERVIGQEDGVAAVAQAVRRARAGLKDPNRPIGSFVFLGPTGVGKTELARALAELLFDDENNMVRIDMSEYMEKHAVSRLIGAPPGYVGYDEGGQLTEAVRRRPYSVILFDEIEKAHADVFNVLLQLLDDGRLTDSQGRTVDFKNTVVIMTSNLGSEVFNQAEGSYDEKIEVVQEALRRHFRPEFINRIDDVVVFHPLTQQQIRQIVDVQFKQLSKRLAERRLNITMTDAARDFLAQHGYDPVYGARPLKRAIQRHVLDPLAMELISGRIEDGAAVEIDEQDGRLKFYSDPQFVA